MKKGNKALSLLIASMLWMNMIGSGIVSAYNTGDMSQKIQEVKDLGILKVINTNKATNLKVIKWFMNLKQITDWRV